MFDCKYPKRALFFILCLCWLFFSNTKKYQPPEYISSLPLQALALVKEGMCKLKQKFEIFCSQLIVKTKLNFQMILPLSKPDERPAIERIYKKKLEFLEDYRKQIEFPENYAKEIELPENYRKKIKFPKDYEKRIYKKEYIRNQ